VSLSVESPECPRSRARRAETRQLSACPQTPESRCASSHSSACARLRSRTSRRSPPWPWTCTVSSATIYRAEVQKARSWPTNPFTSEGMFQDLRALTSLQRNGATCLPTVHWQALPPCLLCCVALTSERRLHRTAMLGQADGIYSPFPYEASPSVDGWAPNDIQAHISPLKTAGPPDAPTVFSRSV
jgi:hypothetical protein